ncbi:MAG: hypothetical protein ACKN9K_08975, partial [Dolichospermum sp.]
PAFVVSPLAFNAKTKTLWACPITNTQRGWAFVLLPDHFHCLWTLPANDSDLSVQLRLIKTYVTKHYGQALGINRDISLITTTAIAIL